jgi:hypothetical protein
MGENPRCIQLVQRNVETMRKLMYIESKSGALDRYFVTDIVRLPLQAPRCEWILRLH